MKFEQLGKGRGWVWVKRNVIILNLAKVAIFSINKGL